MAAWPKIKGQVHQPFAVGGGGLHRLVGSDLAKGALSDVAIYLEGNTLLHLVLL